MSKHDSLFIEKFQPKQYKHKRRNSNTPVMDFVFDTLGFKEKRRNRLARKSKRNKKSFYDGAYFKGW